jgi:hypothetical protein
MDGNTLYGMYYEKIVQITFVVGSESNIQYGDSVTGYIVTPIKPSDHTVLIDNTYNYRGIKGRVQELTKLCLIPNNANRKAKPGYNDPEFKLLNEGFNCKDILNIEII